MFIYFTLSDTHHPWPVFINMHSSALKQRYNVVHTFLFYVNIISIISFSRVSIDYSHYCRYCSKTSGKVLWQHVVRYNICGALTRQRILSYTRSMCLPWLHSGRTRCLLASISPLFLHHLAWNVLNTDSVTTLITQMKLQNNDGKGMCEVMFFISKSKRSNWQIS